MSSTIYDHVTEIELLIKNGVLDESMTYHFKGHAQNFLSLYNRIDDRRLAAEISYECNRQEKAFTLCVTEQIAHAEAEIISMYRHVDVAHLVRTAKGFLCIYPSDEQKTKNTGRNNSFTIQADARLCRSFEEASEAYGECPVVVLRQLMRYFVGSGPDPRAFLSLSLTHAER
jgi:hypothetical protein